jgi:hypothetical protein
VSIKPLRQGLFLLAALVAPAIAPATAPAIAGTEASPPPAGSLKIAPPASGAYLGAFADFGPAEDDVTEAKIRAFAELSGKKLAWAYFSNNWLGGAIRFPAESVAACKRAGVVPYIRLAPWSEMVDFRTDKVFSMQAILSGRFDSDLAAWARSARDSGTPLMIEFGPEANGDWFPWNGRWNGGARATSPQEPHWPDGPRRFRDAYRRLIDIFRAQEALNATWVLHVDAAGTPSAEWNRVKYYYPGDDYIDWIGVSVFGAQLPTHQWILFPTVLRQFWPQIDEAAPGKPVLISEFAVIEDAKDPLRKSQWLRQAMSSVSRGLFKQVKGMTYWHSPGWLPSKKADFSIDSSPASLATYRTEAAQPFWRADAEVESASKSPALPAPPHLFPLISR